MDKVNCKLLILHEHELRKAAVLLNEALEAQQTDAFPGKARDALNACIIALHGLHDQEQHPLVMVSSTDRLIGPVEAYPEPTP